MEITEHIETLELEGRRLAEAAEIAGPGTPVPTCPGWAVRDLVKHLGYVHRWATEQLAVPRPEMVGGAGEREVLESGPKDDALLAWFRAGHATLVDTLRRADPSLPYWSFLPAPSPLAFWARRQAHETAVHRADAESSLGGIGAFESPFAADGLDELLTGFAPTERARAVVERRRVLAVEPDDVPQRWLIGLGPDGVDITAGPGGHDCALRGPASSLYLLMWNRGDPELLGVEVAGEAELLGRWRDSLQVRWSD